MTAATAGDGTGVIGKSLIVDNGSDAERFDLVIVDAPGADEPGVSFVGADLSSAAGITFAKS